MEKAELCYESLYSVGAFGSICVNLSDSSKSSAFLYDCNGCEDCFLCTNLRNKRFCFENKQLTEEEYREKRKQIDLGSYQQFQFWFAKYLQMMRETAIHRQLTVIYCEDSTGDFLYKCKHMRDCYDVMDSEDTSYCIEAAYLKDCQDIYESAFACELQYDAYSCNRAHSILFTGICYDCSNLLYCSNCHNSQNLFGCIGLRHKEYCILNKQYSKEEYEAIVPRLIDLMRKCGEWGEHFPVSLSPFGYNDTVAHEQWPITAADAKERGWPWKSTPDPKPNVARVILASELPDSIDDIPDDLLHWAVTCEVTGKPFRITKQELDFYRKMHVPVPHLHPDERYRRRMALRSPRRLLQRHCNRCQAMIFTTYPETGPEIVYCEKCYLETVY